MAQPRPIKWLASTVGKRNYLVEYLRESSPAGSKVIGTGNERFTSGFASCDDSFLMPAIGDPAYLDAVEELCQAERVDAVVTFSDLDVMALSKIRARLAQLGVCCFFPDEKTANRFGNKLETFEYLRDQDIGVPRTTEILEEALADIGFPLVIKPRLGSAGSGVSIVESVSDAESHWASIDSPIAQEYLDGRLINAETCCATDGSLLGVSIWERHSTVAGETLCATTIRHQAAQDLAISVIDSSPVPGPVDMDLVERDGKLFVIEVNTRFGGGYPVSHLAGADFPSLMVGSMFGKTPQEHAVYESGVTMMKALRPFAFDPRHVQGRREHEKN